MYIVTVSSPLHSPPLSLHTFTSHCRSKTSGPGGVPGYHHMGLSKERAPKDTPPPPHHAYFALPSSHLTPGPRYVVMVDFMFSIIRGCLKGRLPKTHTHHIMPTCTLASPTSHLTAGPRYVVQVGFLFSSIQMLSKERDP